MKSNLKRHWEEKRDQNSLIKSFVLLEQKFLISIFFKLSFEAITGDSWESDIALDDIWWKVGKCGKFKLTLRVHGIETFFKLYNWNPNPSLLTFFLSISTEDFIPHFKYYACICAFLHVWKSYSSNEIMFIQNMIKWGWILKRGVFMPEFGLNPLILTT